MITVSGFNDDNKALDEFGAVILINNNGTIMALVKDTDADTDKLKVVIESIND